MHTERRRTPRYPFIAMAEIFDERENARKSTKISDLSRDGCYVETADPFPQGTNVTIEIYTESESVETQATVVYLHPKEGMGLSFREMPEYYANTLKKWLKEANRLNVS